MGTGACGGRGAASPGAGVTGAYKFPNVLGTGLGSSV